MSQGPHRLIWIVASALAACGPPAVEGPRVAGVVDPEGFFATTEALVGEVHPGSNVRCLVRPAGTGEGLLVGRLAQPGGPATCYARSGDEPFDSVALDLRPGPPQRPALLEALRAGRVAAGRGPVAAEFDAILRSLRPEAAAVPAARPPRPAPVVPPELPPGAPLGSWLRDDHVFARFRSVEAMYRFVGLADDVAGGLLLRAGDARDHRTQWRAFYDLVLPMVWRTNPSAEKGVGEVALLLPGPGGASGSGGRTGRGRPAAALLLRITRADLHESQTRAGIALGYREDHLRRPLHDPFPATQSPAGARATAGDVEIVATDEWVLATVLSADGSEDVRDAFEAALRDADASPPRGNRAFFAFVPAAAGAQWRSAAAREAEAQARARRQTRGLRSLAAHMTGLFAAPAEAAASVPPLLPVMLGDVVWADAHTDPRGATVRIETRDEEAAGRIAAALSAPAPDAAAAAAMCGRNLADVLPVARVERRVPDLAERSYVWLGWAPVCPSGGSYRAHPVTGTPSCSLHGDLAAVRQAGSAPEWPLSGVELDGARLTFRLAIDWSRRE